MGAEEGVLGHLGFPVAIESDHSVSTEIVRSDEGMWKFLGSRGHGERAPSLNSEVDLLAKQ